MNLNMILAMGSPPQPGQQSPPFWTSLPMLAFMVIAVYLLLIRPPQKKAKEQANMLKSLRPGDKILTSGGILGVVINVKEKSVSIRSADSKMEITKSAVAEILERSGDSSES
jgi:preprotein translocase subunit YajC